jgi:hypothetical protein
MPIGTRIRQNDADPTSSGSTTLLEDPLFIRIQLYVTDISWGGGGCWGESGLSTFDSVQYSS